MCEALIDALTFWCVGYRNVTASYGVKGFNADHLAAFKQYGTERVLIAYDRDDAGEKAAGRLSEKLLSEGIDCYRNITAIGSLRMDYDGKGRLTRVHTQTGVEYATYHYDGQNRRTFKDLNGYGETPTRYRHDEQGRLLYETDSQGNPKALWIWDDAAPVAVIQTRQGTARIRYLATDHQGTLRAAFDRTGRLTWRNEGNAFMYSMAETYHDTDGYAIPIHLRYPGQLYEPETGFHYNWHRYYDPKIGRYLSSDPIGLAGGLNTYAYVYNNPLRWVDPTGLFVGGP